MGNPTFRDIAAKAGVSRAAVSLALRDSREVSQKTKLRIVQAAEELGYRPNPTVSALMAHIRSGRKVRSGSTIGLLGVGRAPEYLKSDNYAIALLEAIQDRCEAHGYNLAIFTSTDIQESCDSLQRRAEYTGVEGVIFLPVAQTHQDEQYQIISERIAAVAIGHSQKIDKINRVCHDHFAIVHQLVDECHLRGYQRIGLQVQPKFNLRSGCRYVGAFYAAKHDHGLDTSSEFVYYADEVRAPDFITWIKTCRLDCVISEYHDLLPVLEENGYQCPDELGFAALRYMKKYPHISGMDHDVPLLGSTAVDLLVSQIYHNDLGAPLNNKRLTVSPTWKEGTTLRPKT